MCDIDAVKFNACYARRIDTDWAGIPVPVISAADLLKNKKATGRLKDKADVDYLTRMAQRSKRKSKK
jgi:hypothetical protein